MPVITISGEFSFDLADVDDDDLEGELHRRRLLFKKIEADIINAQEPATADDFENEDLIAVLRKRGIDYGDWIDRVYELIARGDIVEAMDLMQRENLRLAPPVPCPRHRGPHLRSVPC
ncbi:hypothetical protein [Shinella zoogloeoides]|uniref:hypothetical protein n=1 Tax=Shinella zoogloeoides TaxID=352475 RepID=UPI0028AB2638|nr:hypothetical protein [Shinella zoogloeoides]